jgi:hypothetical protein
MPRSLPLFIVLIGLLSSACGLGKPVPTSSTDAATTGIAPPAPVEAAKPAAGAGSVSTSSLPQAKAEAAFAPSPLRNLALQYLESDGHGGWRKNEKAATELEKLSPEESQQVWALLADPQVEVRRSAAVFLLPQLDPANGNQVAAFAALLDDRDRMVRARAIDAARQFSRGDQLAALPRLARLLDPQHEDRAENRAAVARLCAFLKREASDALPALASAASNDPDAKVRAAALVAAASVSTPAAALQALRQGLLDREAAVRLVAASRLRQMGPGASPAAPELAAALGDSNSGVAEVVAEALIGIGTPAVQPLAGQLSSGNGSARKLALASLATLGPAAKTVAAAIEKCRQDPDPQVRQLAETALNRIAAP